MGTCGGCSLPRRLPARPPGFGQNLDFWAAHRISKGSSGRFRWETRPWPLARRKRSWRAAGPVTARCKTKLPIPLPMRSPGSAACCPRGKAARPARNAGSRSPRPGARPFPASGCAWPANRNMTATRPRAHPTTAVATRTASCANRPSPPFPCPVTGEAGLTGPEKRTGRIHDHALYKKRDSAWALTSPRADGILHTFRPFCAPQASGSPQPGIATPAGPPAAWRQRPQAARTPLPGRTRRTGLARYATAACPHPSPPGPIHWSAIAVPRLRDRSVPPGPAPINGPQFAKDSRNRPGRSRRAP